MEIEIQGIQAALDALSEGKKVRLKDGIAALSWETTQSGLIRHLMNRSRYWDEDNLTKVAFISKDVTREISRTQLIKVMSEHFNAFRSYGEVMQSVLKELGFDNE